MSSRGFRPFSDFVPSDASPYQLLPFRFRRWDDGEVLLVNDVGEFTWVTSSEFRTLISHSLPRSSPKYLELAGKHFVSEAGALAPLELLATKYRTRKSFLEGFLRLHIFVVTLRCETSCPYCQVSRVTEDRTRFDMTSATAARAVDLMFSTPGRDLKVEFQGGEPLLHFDRIREVVERIGRINVAERRNVEFVVATNLAMLDESMLEFLRDHKFFVSTSLDGPAFIHNANRPRSGANSYDLVTRNIETARNALGADRVAAVMTTTALSLAHPEEIVDEYVRRGLNAIFLRPVSPYGFAIKTRAASQYDDEAFLAFFRRALNRIIELNRSGVGFLEVYSQILLRRILTPFTTGYVDLQSPAGAGTAVAVYNYDGDVYASDEARMLAEMGDFSFRLGNVHRDSFADLFSGKVVQGILESSCLETLPGCSDCAFVPFCGSDPIYHWATQRDPIGHRPTSGFCKKNIGIITHLLELMRSHDPFIERLFISWATQPEAGTRTA